jgi:hypothetical protein
VALLSSPLTTAERCPARPLPSFAPSAFVGGPCCPRSGKTPGTRSPSASAVRRHPYSTPLGFRPGPCHVRLSRRPHARPPCFHVATKIALASCVPKPANPAPYHIRAPLARVPSQEPGDKHGGAPLSGAAARRPRGAQRSGYGAAAGGGGGAAGVPPEPAGARAGAPRAPGRLLFMRCWAGRTHAAFTQWPAARRPRFGPLAGSLPHGQLLHAQPSKAPHRPPSISQRRSMPPPTRRLQSLGADRGAPRLALHPHHCGAAQAGCERPGRGAGRGRRCLTMLVTLAAGHRQSEGGWLCWVYDAQPLYMSSLQAQLHAPRRRRALAPTQAALSSPPAPAAARTSCRSFPSRRAWRRPGRSPRARQPYSPPLPRSQRLGFKTAGSRLLSGQHCRLHCCSRRRGSRSLRPGPAGPDMQTADALAVAALLAPPSSRPPPPPRRRGARAFLGRGQCGRGDAGGGRHRRAADRPLCVLGGGSRAHAHPDVNARVCAHLRIQPTHTRWWGALTACLRGAKAPAPRACLFVAPDKLHQHPAPAHPNGPPPLAPPHASRPSATGRPARRCAAPTERRAAGEGCMGPRG